MSQAPNTLWFSVWIRILHKHHAPHWCGACPKDPPAKTQHPVVLRVSWDPEQARRTLERLKAWCFMWPSDPKKPSTSWCFVWPRNSEKARSPSQCFVPSATSCSARPDAPRGAFLAGSSAKNETPHGPSYCPRILNMTKMWCLAWPKDPEQTPHTLFKLGLRDPEQELNSLRFFVWSKDPSQAPNSLCSLVWPRDPQAQSAPLSAWPRDLDLAAPSARR